MTNSLGKWILPQFSYEDGMGRIGPYPNEIMEAERRFQLRIDHRTPLDDFLNKVTSDSELFLDVVEYCCAKDRHNERRLVELEVILSQAGSCWRVYKSEDSAGLTRRVDEITQKEYEASVQANGGHSGFLANAWNTCYGRNPSPSESYRDSIRAVEVVAIATIEPNNASATLGTVIGSLKASPDRWGVSSKSGRAQDAEDLQTVIAMLTSLWRGQYDRHGSPSEQPIPMTQERAEWAVHLSIALCRMFTSGLIHKQR